jgi:hypothetical protein
MVLDTSRRLARALPWLRLLAPLPISLLLGHNTVFATQFGLEDDLRRAMTGGGHDGYWTAFSLVILVLASGLLLRAGVRAIGLRQHLSRIGPTPAAGTRSGDYRSELRLIWTPPFVGTAIGIPA